MLLCILVCVVSIRYDSLHTCTVLYTHYLTYNLIYILIHWIYIIHTADSILWRETEGAIEWIQSIVNKHTLIPPIYNPTTTSITSPLTSSSATSSSSTSDVEVEGGGEGGGGIDQHKMFLGMYNTAIEMATAT